MNEITRNDIKRQYRTIIRIGYCDLYHLTKRLRKIGYNAGVYGWNYNAFELDYNTCIITGYRAFDKGTIRLSSEFIQYIEDKTIEIINNNNSDYDEQLQQIDLLKQEFLREYKNNILK